MIEKVETSKILLYKSNGGSVYDVYFEDETFWLTQKTMSELFDVESHTITYHLQKIFKSGELDENSTTRKIRVVQTE